MQTYFSKLPNIFYNNQQCKDITRRVKLDQNPRVTPYLFYPYEIENELRSDQVSENYYDDPFLDWFIYVTNGIVDPFYGWYVSEDKFNDLMVQKYGSLELALKKIKFYRNNWDNDSTELSVSSYNNTLPLEWRKYYDPIWATKSKVISYKRKQIDTTINTNRIIEYNAGNNFIVGEIMDVKATLNGSALATGEVVFSNSTITRVQSVIGNTFANTSLPRVVFGETSKSFVTVTQANTIVENITSSEEVFWSPVSFYDWEREKNEQRKNIDLIGNRSTLEIMNEIDRKLSEA